MLQTSREPKVDRSRICEIEAGFRLLLLDPGQRPCSTPISAVIVPSYEPCTLLKPAPRITRSDSIPNEVLDAKLEHGS